MLTQIQKQVVEVFRIALRCLCCESNEIINWTDEIISAHSNPPYDLIEISAGGTDIFSKLGKLPTNDDLNSSLRIVLGRMYALASRDRQRLEDFASGLNQIALESEQNLAEDLLFCNYIADEYNLASTDIYGSLSDVQENFLELLKPYWSQRSSETTWDLDHKICS